MLLSEIISINVERTKEKSVLPVEVAKAKELVFLRVFKSFQISLLRVEFMIAFGECVDQWSDKTLYSWIR